MWIVSFIIVSIYLILKYITTAYAEINHLIHYGFSTGDFIICSGLVIIGVMLYMFINAWRLIVC